MVFTFRRSFWLARARRRNARRRSELTVVLLGAISLPVSPTAAILGACFALAAATLLFIFYIQPDASDLAPHRSKLDQLMERRDAIYDNLRDLRFEYRAGKYSEADFEAMKTATETEAALVLAEIDQVTDAGVRRPRGSRTAPERGPR
jgi:hypothetical protein